MNLRLIREPSAAGATLGSLYVDGVWECWVLEDVIREVYGQPVEAWKVPGVTAIPSGQYRIDLTYSNRFRRVLPELLSVPGFSGVRIHPGNHADDTEGCLLPGKERQGATVLHSADAFDALFAKLSAVSAARWITIINPDTVRGDASKADLSHHPIERED